MKKGILLVLLAALMWGTLPMFTRFLYASGSDPYTAAAWRVYIAALIFLISFFINGTFKKIKLRRDIPFYLVYGPVAISGTFLFYMMAIEQLSTALAAMLLYTSPGWVTLFSRIFYKEPITRIKIAALACTFGGCFLVVRGYDFAALSASFFGIVIGILSGICYSMVTVMGRKADAMHDAFTNTGMMILFGALVFFFFRPPWRLGMPSPPQWGGYLGIALLGSVGPFFCYNKGLASGLDGGIASLIAIAEPVVATILGVAVFHDELELLQALGILIVLAGVMLPLLHAQRKKRREAPVPPQKPPTAPEQD